MELFIIIVLAIILAPIIGGLIGGILGFAVYSVSFLFNLFIGLAFLAIIYSIFIKSIMEIWIYKLKIEIEYINWKLKIFKMNNMTYENYC